MVMWRSIVVFLVLALSASGVLAQERSTRTLFEVLFGSGNEEQQNPGRPSRLKPAKWKNRIMRVG